jgi:hypothetical protein
MKIRRVVAAHQFFCQKSQHFVLGNWSQYVPLIKNWSLNRRKLNYLLYFPVAYTKFMYYTLCCE